MNEAEIISDVVHELKNLGYSQKIEIKENRLYFLPKSLFINPTDLFFIDATFFIDHESIVFAISLFPYNIKALLKISQLELNTLRANGYEVKLAVELKQYKPSNETLAIKRQYGMRKILKANFKPERYELRQGFPDFPSCPYGNAFKALGYDTEKKEYVRLASSILKSGEIKINKFK